MHNKYFINTQHDIYDAIQIIIDDEIMIFAFCPKPNPTHTNNSMTKSSSLFDCLTILLRNEDCFIWRCGFSFDRIGNFGNSIKKFVLCDNSFCHIKVKIFLMTQSQSIPQIIFVGDTAVGKTSIISRQINNEFMEHGQTVAANSCKMNIDGHLINVWDTAGQERFQAITSTYYHNKDAYVVVFDLSNESTFDHLSSWLNDIKQHKENPNVIIVGNKSDLQHKVERETMENFAKAENAKLFLTSAYTGENVNQFFQYIANYDYQRAQTADHVNIETKTSDSNSCNC